VRVSVGDTAVADWTFGPGNASGDRIFPIPLSAIGSDGVVTVRFELPDAQRPSDFGISDDRLLGLGVRSLRISTGN
jgi:hypothetical protein